MKSLAKQSAMSLAILAVMLPAALAVPVQDTYQIDGAHSFVIFKVKHQGVGNAYGRFNDISGTITFNPDDLSNAMLDITVRAESVDTAAEKRDQHLRSPDFLNTRQFPVITFKSRSVNKAGSRYEVSGDLMLHGVTRPITATFELVGQSSSPGSGYHIGGETEFAIKRSEFGMDYSLNGISDDVQITVAIEAAHK